MEQIPSEISDQFEEVFVDVSFHGNGTGTVAVTNDSVGAAPESAPPPESESRWRIDPALTLLRKEGLCTRLRHYDARIRCMAWRCFLELLPSGTSVASTPFVQLVSSTWTPAVHAWRQRYAELKTEAFVDPRGSQVDQIDPAVHNPLSDAQDSLWNVYWQNEELKKEIHRDVVRCYPEMEWFQAAQVQDLMLRVLYVYAKHSPLGYRQGMHELLAPIVLILHRERDSASTHPLDSAISPDHSALSSFISLLSDPIHLEHDAYALLDAVLQRAGEWFESHTPAQPSNAPSSSPSVLSPIVKKCRYIQDALLLKYDSQLHAHLSSLSIEPQLFLLRWLRLLFGREFHVEDALVIWDAIFAFDSKLSLVDYFSTAMLMFIRTQLIGKDYTSCIRRLLKFPPIEDVSVLVEHALALTKPKPPPIPSTNEFGSPRLENPVHISSITPAEHTPSKPSPAHAHTNTRHGAPLQASVAASDRLRELELRHSILGRNLEKVIEGLQAEVVKPELNASVSESLVLAIAELKRTKDIAFGFLDVSESVDFVSDACHTASAQQKQQQHQAASNTGHRSDGAVVKAPSRPSPIQVEVLKIGEGVVDDIFS